MENSFEATQSKNRKSRGKKKGKNRPPSSSQLLNVNLVAPSPCGSSPTSPVDSTASSDSLPFTTAPRVGDMVERPNFGRVGRVVNVWANVFKLKIGDGVVHHYDLDIQKVAAPRGGGRGRGRGRGRGGRGRGGGRDVVIGPVKFKEEIELVYQQLIRQVKFPAGTSFDGSKNIYIPNFKIRNIVNYEITLMIEDKQRKFQVTVSHVSEVSWQDMDRFIGRRTLVPPSTGIAALDVALRHVAATQSQNIAIRNAIFSFNHLARNISPGMQAWGGYVQAAKPCQMGLVLNMNSCFTPMVKSETVAEFMKAVVDKSQGRNIPIEEIDRYLTDALYAKIEKKLDKLKAKTIHRSENERHFKIAGFRQTTSITERFKTREGRNVNVAQHMRQLYNYNVRYPKLKLVKIYKGKTESPKEAFPPECVQIKAVPYKRELNKFQKEMMTRAATMKPRDKTEYITGCMNSQLTNPQFAAHLKAWDVNINQTMESIPTRILPSPDLLGGDDAVINVQGRGEWDLDNKFKEPAKLKSWAVVNFCGASLPDPRLKEFVVQLMKIMKERGMQVPDDIPVKRTADRQRLYQSEKYLEAVARDAEEKFNSKCQIILVIMPNFVDSQRDVSTDDLYTQIKVASDQLLGIPSQCVLSTNAGLEGGASVNLNAYLSNLVLKINAKLGGINSIYCKVESGPRPTFSYPRLGRKPFMVMGADLTHPPPGSDEKQSVIGVVASMDEHLSKYACRTMYQPEGLDTGREVIRDLKPAVKELLETYFARNYPIKPEAILFYRDGVSQGEFPKVVQHEYQAIRDACAEMGDRSSDYCPAITFIIVQKRHGIRLFPQKSADADETGNILPGTVIDTHICHPHGFDFYLNSHKAISGTSRPTLYSVLVDEVGFDADSLQLLTYYMCHLFCRCTRSVSYCPPAYYAHHAASRGKILLPYKKNKPSAIHNELKNTLFFI